MGLGIHEPYQATCCFTEKVIRIIAKVKYSDHTSTNFQEIQHTKARGYSYDQTWKADACHYSGHTTTANVYNLYYK